MGFYDGTREKPLIHGKSVVSTYHDIRVIPQESSWFSYDIEVIPIKLAGVDVVT